MRVYYYIVRRLLLAIPAILAVTALVFFLTRAAGDPVAIYTSPEMDRETIEMLREAYGLNKPVYLQYFYYLNGLLHGDWGYSHTVNMPVIAAISRYLPATLELGLVSFIITIVLGIQLGTLAAVHREKPIDIASRLFAIGGFSVPRFWLGIVLVYVFYYLLGLVSPGRLAINLIVEYFPPHGNFQVYTGFYVVDSILNGNLLVFRDSIIHLVLPALTMAYTNVAILTRVVRSSMLRALNEDYILTAKAKGVDRNTIVKKHALRNALISTITMTGLIFAEIIAGSVLTETVFAWPGIGAWAARCAMMLDTAGILGFALFIGVSFIIINIAVDVLYAYLNPRIEVA
jgi:peptide/nickel transport system permease protein